MMTPTPDPQVEDRDAIAIAAGVMTERGRRVQPPKRGRRKAPRQGRTWVRRVFTLGLAR
jgi:hypothetical protein